jgi:hypothetical protein
MTPLNVPLVLRASLVDRGEPIIAQAKLDIRSNDD